MGMPRKNSSSERMMISWMRGVGESIDGSGVALPAAEGGAKACNERTDQQCDE